MQGQGAGARNRAEIICSQTNRQLGGNAGSQEENKSRFELTDSKYVAQEKIHLSSSKFPCVTQTKRTGPLALKLHELFLRQELKLLL